MTPATTANPRGNAIAWAHLGTTELLEPQNARQIEPQTTASLRRLEVTSGLQTLQDVLWGDAELDKYTYRQVRNLEKQGPTPAPGHAVDVRE